MSTTAEVATSTSPGVASKTFAVNIVNDTEDEPSETVNLALSLPSAGFKLGTPKNATVTITDNDTAGKVQFSAASFSALETDANATITVTRSGGTSSGATVQYATSDGSATAGTNYTTTTGTLTFALGQTKSTFTVPMLIDGAGNGNKYLNLTLGNPGKGLTLGTLPTAVLWVVDN